MRLTKHIAIILVLAFTMSYYLYSYKPREYNSEELVALFAGNITLWFFIFGIPYLVVGFLFVFVKRYLFK